LFHSQIVQILLLKQQKYILMNYNVVVYEVPQLLMCKFSENPKNTSQFHEFNEIITQILFKLVVANDPNDKYFIHR